MQTDWIMVPAFPLVAGAFLLILLPGRVRSIACLEDAELILTCKALTLGFLVWSHAEKYQMLRNLPFV